MLKYPQNRPKTGVLGRFDPFLGYIASNRLKIGLKQGFWAVLTPFWAI